MTDHQGSEQTAQPIVKDTGTIFREEKWCAHCHQPIERTAPEPARGRAWVHSATKSERCYQ